MGARRILLTHGHLDHAAGVPYLIAQRNMQAQYQNDVYTPPGLRARSIKSCGSGRRSTSTILNTP